MLSCPPDVITMLTSGWARRARTVAVARTASRHRRRRPRERRGWRPPHHRRGQADREHLLAGVQEQPGATELVEAPSRLDDRPITVERIDPAEARDRHVDRAGGLEERVVRRTEVVVERPARRSDEALDAGGCRRDGELARACGPPARNRFSPATTRASTIIGPT